MKYMGSKRRIAKYILPIMLRERKGMPWVEPFVGGANMIDKVLTGVRIGSDAHKYLIDLLIAIRDGWIPPEIVTEEEYKKIKTNPGLYESRLVGFVGFGCSFGGKWWNGYARDRMNSKTNFARMAKNNLLKQASSLKGIDFRNCSYDKLILPPEPCLIYCDPPYSKTSKYKGIETFDSNKFYQWCRDRKEEGHTVFVSEYNAPDDFELVWQMEITCAINNQKTKNRNTKRTEKLYRV